MKSITQINLARLTVRKSLSKTDSAQLQPPALITIGGAVSQTPCSHRHARRPPSADRKYLQLHTNSFFLAASQHDSAVRNLPTALN